MVRRILISSALLLLSPLRASRVESTQILAAELSEVSSADGVLDVETSSQKPGSQRKRGSSRKKSSTSKDKELHFVGKDPKTLLGKCEGDCDSDRNCQKGLKCFQRPRFDPYRPVPGCSGRGSGGSDYCFDDGSSEGVDSVKGTGPFQGHPIELKKVPFKCDDEDCDVGGCVKGKDGQWMVRFEPVGKKYIWPNPAWGGLHVTMTSFSNYSDPMGKFERLRNMLKDHDKDWKPGSVWSKKKECKGEKSIRIDFVSDYVDSVGKMLDEIGFKAKRGTHKHISVEEGMDGASIVEDFKKERANWNLVLLTARDNYIEKMATIKAKYKR